MPAFAINITYSGLKAKYLQAYKQRSGGFPRAFLRDDIKTLRMPLPKLVYLLDWEQGQLMCYWEKEENDVGRAIVDGVRERFEAVREDTAFLGALEISQMGEAPTSPLPESLIPGVPDTVTFKRKRPALAPKGVLWPPEPEPKKPRLQPPSQAVLDDHSETGITFSTGPLPVMGSQILNDARVPLAPIVNSNAARSGPATNSARLGSTGSTTPGAAGSAARRTRQSSMKRELKEELPPMFLPPRFRRKVKAEVEQDPRRNLMHEATTLRREIMETYQRDVKLVAEHTRMQKEVALTERRIWRLEGKIVVIAEECAWKFKDELHVDPERYFRACESHRRCGLDA
ncbi:hypothetical protein DAEQUDRAFT_764547 [Daedalea quercina L-15889]|uniref:Uncharacterized protein n=1 Tax=Daedalea quercina L-15889 TaxID=1314783 RepID=A0A165RFF9_9APHY|nr:hypothetical protein DAEQUDRAFT_764547 [Daedalea quercina L-15889]